MTARLRDPGEESQLDAYGDVISRVRAGVPRLSTEELRRIRELLEGALASELPDYPDALAELALTLDFGA